MNTNAYKVVITLIAYKETRKIYNYLTEELYAEKAAKNLMRKIETKIQILEHLPKIYVELEKVDKFGKKYRKIIINNYIILYFIDEEKQTVVISHIYYAKSNYINKF